jgi:hypothetical protein
MKNETTDLKSIAQKFFAAYDAHDVDGMLTFCADGALGRERYLNAILFIDAGS